MMKRVSAVLVTVVMLLSMVCTVAFAEPATDAAKLTVSVADTVKRGEDVVVTLGVADATVDFSAILVELTFDDADFTYKSADMSAYPGALEEETVTAPGSVKLSWVPVDNADKGEAFTLGTVTLTANEDAALDNSAIEATVMEASTNDTAGIPYDVTVTAASDSIAVECAHDFENSEWVAPADNTAKEDARHYRECACDDCEEKEYEDCVFVWSEELSVKHTDTQPGTDVYVCSTCEYQCSVAYAAGHEYTLYYEAATATKDGAWTKVCPLCDDEEVTPITAGYPGTDVRESAWFYNYAQYAKATGLMVGNTAGAFNPAGTMTRGAFASVVARIYYGSADAIPTFTEYTLSDLKGKWYANAAQAMANKGIIAGSAGKFNGDNALNMAAAISILHRLYSEMYGTDDVSFGPAANWPFNDDAKIPNWAKADIEWAAEAGLVAGDSAGNVNALNPCKRQQLAVLITKYDVAAREIVIVSPDALADALGQ